MQKAPQKNEISDESWDIKKILIVLLVVVPILLLIFSYKDFIIDSLGIKNIKPQQVKEVPVVSNMSSSPSNIQKEAQNKIDSIKTQIEGLNVVEIATTSAQVQKIINDIKALPNYPASQAKNLCLKLCDGL